MTVGRLYDLIADLPLEVDGYELEPLEQDVSSDFTRHTTVIHLRGGGEEGLGEDVSYDALDHIAFQDLGAVHELAGSHTIDSFSQLLEGLELFADPPITAASGDYRRWAFESAALDLALRQAGRTLAEVVGRRLSPLTFVVSLRLGDPPTMQPLLDRLEHYPDLRFKLDATPSWDDELVAALVATGAVDSIDFKGHYHGTAVDQDPDPTLYERVARAFPDAWIEDPALTPETEAVLASDHDRITWDAPIHSVADIEALAFPPRMVNIKPSRFGPLSNLMDAYDYCEQRDIGAYGGGQFELSVGRGHIQYLAALFHPDAPNDVAPGGYNAPAPGPGLAPSPLAPAPAPAGFRWRG